MRAAGWWVMGWVYALRADTVSENDLDVILWRLDTEIRAARMEQSGCWVAKDAAVCAASSSSSTVVTPGYTPWITFWAITTGSTH